MGASVSPLQSLPWRPCRFTCPHCGETLVTCRAQDTTWYGHRFATWPVSDRLLAAMTRSEQLSEGALLWLAAQGLCDAVHQVQDAPLLSAALTVLKATRAGRNVPR